MPKPLAFMQKPLAVIPQFAQFYRSLEAYKAQLQ